MIWSIEQARQTYAIHGWSDGYFDIDEATGAVVVYPHRTPDKGRIDLNEVLDAIERSKLQYPVLVRFLDILADRVQAITASFQRAIGSFQHDTDYRILYPVKVNQQADVVESILAAGAGLEVGTKAELMVALSYAGHAEYKKNLTIVCNGYKDREYIRLALMMHAMGVHIIIVIEKLVEYALICDEAAKIMPENPECIGLGVRVRLASIAAGVWQNTGGEKSKFGLSFADLLTLVKRLNASGQHLSLLHAHMGSQIAGIQDIETGMHELARVYCELHHLGVKVESLNIGGGLAVDYDGSASNSEFSMDYTLDEFSGTVVRVLTRVLQNTGVPFPDIYSESGRFLTAHHALLITDIVNREGRNTVTAPVFPGRSCPAFLEAFQEMYAQREKAASVNLYRGAKNELARCQRAFFQGDLDLTGQAYAEFLYQSICHFILGRADAKNSGKESIQNEIKEKLADKYFCNFSLFQSLPDVWGLNQLFPIMPLQNLNEPVQGSGTVVDLTCDSDGRIDRYVTGSVLPLAEINTRTGALLGMFMVGAYQETLGDLHNLFGRPDTVNITLRQNTANPNQGENSYSHFHHIKKGEEIADVLAAVGYENDSLRQCYQEFCNGVPHKKREEYWQLLLSALGRSTYLS